MSDDRLTHFDEAGQARMVATQHKAQTRRSALARAAVVMERSTLAAIEAGTLGKGDVLGVARIAGIGGAKATAALIPLCHPVGLTSVDLTFELRPDLPGVEIRAAVTAVDRTGPEMEAMAAATVAALTIYDMCKAIDRRMRVQHVELLEKTGGKSGHFRRDDEAATPR